jgi:hypothetical protein
MAEKVRIRVKAKKPGGRRCAWRGCGVSIEHRGPRAIFCEEHAKSALIQWRKEYDARPENVAKRREYDAKPLNVGKAKVRRNKKIYALGLAIRLLKMDGWMIDQCIDECESRLRKLGRKPPIESSDARGNALPVAAHPWSTMRGKGPRKKRRKRRA